MRFRADDLLNHRPEMTLKEKTAFIKHAALLRYPPQQLTNPALSKNESLLFAQYTGRARVAFLCRRVTWAYSMWEKTTTAHGKEGVTVQPSMWRPQMASYEIPTLYLPLCQAGD